MEIFAGTAGWSYADWYGPFYPKKKEKNFSELEFYSKFFDIVEVNSTFYRLFPPSAAEKWLADVEKNPRFVFIVKLFKEFTHGKRRRDEEFVKNREIFLEFLSPLIEHRKLGGILVQFSEYYGESSTAREYISLLLDEFHDYPLFFELRHTSWYTERPKEFFHQNEINVAVIDQPQLEGMVGFETEVLGKIAYVRLHGRNSEMWQLGRENLRQGKEGDKPDRNARYNYIYNNSELDEIEAKLLSVRDKCSRMYLILNNHPLGKAVVNALQLVSRLRGGEEVKAPDTVIRFFPELAEITKSTNVSQPGDLFGE